jgi:hypothetical protein
LLARGRSQGGAWGEGSANNSRQLHIQGWTAAGSELAARKNGGNWIVLGERPLSSVTSCMELSRQQIAPLKGLNQLTPEVERKVERILGCASDEYSGPDKHGPAAKPSQAWAKSRPPVAK